MDLLVFAHRLEAQCFFDKHHLTREECHFTELYKSPHFYLLICGEGLQKASESMIATLSTQTEISRVINYGVAGFLKPEMFNVPPSFLEVRCHYSENHFHSYQNAEANSEFDCISAHERVLKKEYAKRLSLFAPLADRESWAIARASSLFKKDFRSFKYLSDFADESTDCEDIKSQSSVFSQIFYKEYQKIKPKTTDSQEVETSEIFPSRYFSHGLIQQSQKVLLVLKNKKLNASEIISEILERVLASKKFYGRGVGREVLKELKRAAFPQSMHIEDHIKEFLKEKNLHTILRYLSNHPQHAFKIETPFNTTEELQDILKKLSVFSCEEIDALIEKGLSQ